MCLIYNLKILSTPLPIWHPIHVAQAVQNAAYKGCFHYEVVRLQAPIDCSEKQLILEFSKIYSIFVKAENVFLTHQKFAEIFFVVSSLTLKPRFDDSLRVGIFIR